MKSAYSTRFYVHVYSKKSRWKVTNCYVQETHHVCLILMDNISEGNRKPWVGKDLRANFSILGVMMSTLRKLHMQGLLPLSPEFVFQMR